MNILLNDYNVTQTNINGTLNQHIMGQDSGNGLGIALGGAGLLTGVLGSIFGGAANRKAKNLVNTQIADLTAWRDKGVNQDPMKSNVGQSIMRKALDTAKTQRQTIESSAAVTGASAEKEIAQKAGVQKGLSNTMSNIAGYATAREDQIEGRYRSNLGQLLGRKSALLQGQAQSGSNVASNAGSLLQGLAPMFAGSGTQTIG